MPETDYIEAVNDLALPGTKPIGAPTLVPLLQLPRGKRADLLDALASLRERQDAITEPVEGEDEGVALRRAAAMFRLLEDFEKMLRLAAKEPDAFDAWNESANDADLSQLAGYYMRTFQTGEAPASPTS